MFLGYQEENIEGSVIPTLFISHIAETREELENMPCVTFVKIEETDKTYFLHNGAYVCEVSFDQQIKEVEQTRASLYSSEVDPLMAEYNRKKLFNLFDDGEETALLAEIEKRVAEIKENHKYPVEESIEEVPVEDVAEPVEESEELPVVEEATVSEMENTIEEID